MKIKEILELTQNEPLAEVAKKHLGVSKKRATEAMHNAGCYNKRGLRGWYFDGDESVLEQSFHDFVAPKKSTGKPRPQVNASIDESELLASNSEQKASDIESIASARQEVAVTSESKVNTKAKSSQKKATSELDSIDVLLLQNHSESEKRVYRGFYWDSDIINFLDNVKHGNKSDLMNEIVRTVLKNKGLI